MLTNAISDYESRRNDKRPRARFAVGASVVLAYVAAVTRRSSRGGAAACVQQLQQLSCDGNAYQTTAARCGIYGEPVRNALIRGRGNSGTIRMSTNGG